MPTAPSLERDSAPGRLHLRSRACARYGVLVVGEEMKGSRAYWSQKLRPLGETVGLSRARTSGESPDSTQAGRGPQWPIQLAAISAHPAAIFARSFLRKRDQILE